MIRTLHLSDFLKLGRLHEAEVGLNLPDALVIPNSLFPAALMQHLPVHTASTSVYLFEEDGKPTAFAQAIARRRSDEWNVQALGIVDKSGANKIEEAEAADAENDTAAEGASVEVLEASDETTADEPIFAETSEVEQAQTEVIQEEKAERPTLPDDTELAWQKLLEYLVVDAGEKGVVRVYAKLSTESPEIGMFTQTGFHSYTHESLLTLRYEAPIEPPASLKVRSQRKQDAWPVHQLYSTITPSFVQNSEQMLSRDWEIHKGYFPRPVKEQGWVVEENDKIAAYVRITSNRNKHMLRIMNLDTQRELLPNVVRFALSMIKAGPECQVYATVREYQAEQEAVLEDAGFNYSGKQAVMVKHTVQFVRSNERVLTMARDRKMELAHSARPNFGMRLLAKWPFYNFHFARGKQKQFHD